MAVYLYFVLAGGTFAGVTEPLVVIGAHFLFAVSSLYTAFLAYRGRLVRLGNGADLLLALLFFFLVAAAAIGPIPRITLQFVAPFAGIVALLYAVPALWKKVDGTEVAPSSKGPQNRIVNILFIGLVGVTIAAVGKLALDASAGIRGRPHFPMGHKNFLAGFIVLTLPAAVVFAGNSKGYKRFFGIIAALSAWSLLLGTASLGGVFGAAASCLTGFYFYSKRNARFLRTAGVTGLIILGLILVFIATPGTVRYTSRFANISRAGSDMSVSNRMDYATGAFLALKDAPLKARGAGSTAYLFTADKIHKPNEDVIGKHLSQLHNSYVHLLYEMGIPGTVLVLLLIISLGFPLFKHPKRSFSSEAMICGIFGYAVFAISDSQLHVHAIPLTLVLVYLAAGSGNPGKAADPGLPRWSAAIFGAAGLFTVLFCGWIDIAHTIGHRGVSRVLDELDSGITTVTLRRSFDDLKKAARIDPLTGFYQYEAAVVGQELLQRLSGQEAGTVAAQTASLFKNAVRYSPGAGQYALHAGGFLAQQGDFAKSLEILNIAQAIEIYSPFPRFLSVKPAFAAGMKKTAYRNLLLAILLDPSLTGVVELHQPQKAENGGGLTPEQRLHVLLEPLQDIDPGLTGELVETWRWFENRQAGPEKQMMAEVADITLMNSRSLYIFRRRGIPAVAARVFLMKPQGGAPLPEISRCHDAFRKLERLPFNAVPGRDYKNFYWYSMKNLRPDL